MSKRKLPTMTMRPFPEAETELAPCVLGASGSGCAVSSSVAAAAVAAAAAAAAESIFVSSLAPLPLLSRQLRPLLLLPPASSSSFLLYSFSSPGLHLPQLQPQAWPQPHPLHLMLLLFFSFLGVSGSIYTAKVSTKACAFLDFLVGAYLCPLSCCLLARVEINEQLSRRRRRRRRKWREREAACTCNKRRPYLDTQLAAQWTDMKHEHAPTHNGCGYLNECLPMLVEPSEPTQGLQSFPKTLPLEPARIRRRARNSRSSSLGSAWAIEMAARARSQPQDARNGCSSLPQSRTGVRHGCSSLPRRRRMLEMAAPACPEATGALEKAVRACPGAAGVPRVLAPWP